MKVISFHLRGKMAHFRRYYSNSSALSYSLPPRTTIAGIVAGLLGLPRDSYYEDFSLSNCRIAVKCAAPIKKQMQKLNLLMIKSKSDLNGSQPHHSQTPTELVLPQDIRRGMLDYQVWFTHRDNEIMQRLLALIQSAGDWYCSLGITVALGTAQHLGWLSFAGVLEGEALRPGRAVPVESAIPLHNLQDIELAGNWEDYHLVREELPLEFDSERRATERGRADLLVNLKGKAVPARVNEVVLLGDGKYITWME